MKLLFWCSDFNTSKSATELAMMNCPQTDATCTTTPGAKNNMIELAKGTSSSELTSTNLHLSEKCSWAVQSRYGAP